MTPLVTALAVELRYFFDTVVSKHSGALMNNEMTGYVFAFLFFAAIGLVSFGLWRFVSALRSSDPVARGETRRKARIALVCSVGMVVTLALATTLYTEVDLRIGDAGR